MRALAHPDYLGEKEHLENTLKKIQEWKNVLLEQAQAGQEEVEEILARLADAKKPEDMTQAQRFEMSRIEGALNRRSLLSLAEKDPYFGRLDLTLLEYTFHHVLNFEQSGSAQSKGGRTLHNTQGETIYLGKFGVENEKGGDQLIVDWRAPVADLYYSGIQGLTQFEGPYGPVKADLHLLRRFLIEEGILKEIADAEEASGIDDFLLSRLKESSGSGIKEIIATIQKDQNEIIRSPLKYPVLVQGVAGSGKTSVALHRLSYLLYAHKKDFYPEDTLILTPSRLFFNYISTIMPDLDIKRCVQKTFSELALSILPGKYSLISTLEWMSEFSDAKNPEDFQPLIKEAKLKGSLKAIEAVDHYFDFLSQVIIPDTDLKTQDGIIIVKKQDLDYYYKDLEHLPLVKRIAQIHRWLNKQSKLSIVREKERIYQSFEGPLEIARRRHPHHLQHMPNPEAISLLRARDLALKNFEDQTQEALKDFKRQMPGRLAFKALYQEFYNPENLSKFWPQLNEDEINILSKRFVTASSRIMQEDLALMLRLYELCYGFEISYNYIVADEAQDLNLSEIFIIKRLINDNSSLTLVGDLAQGIYPHRGFKTWEEVIDVFFKESSPVYRQMNLSYRSSAEITNFANRILKKNNIAPAQAIRTSGNEPTIYSFEQSPDVWAAKAEKAVELIENWLKDENIKKIAIICKNNNNCRSLGKHFKKYSKHRTMTIDKENYFYDAPVIIIPAHLAKGLEFDATILADAEAQVYKNNHHEMNLFYVAATRPLHRLALFHQGELVSALT